MASSLPSIAFTLHGKRYINITNRCTLRCGFCPKAPGDWLVNGRDLRLRREPSVGEIVAAAEDPQSYDEIVFCGLGEPTLRLYDMMAAAFRLHGRGARIGLNTDGLASLVYGRNVAPDLEGGIDAVRVSLNAQDEATYVRHCRPLLPGAYRAMLRFAESAREFVPDVTLTAVPGLEGVDLQACERIAQDMGVKFRLRARNEVDINGGGPPLPRPAQRAGEA